MNDWIEIAIKRYRTNAKRRGEIVDEPSAELCLIDCNFLFVVNSHRLLDVYEIRGERMRRIPECYHQELYDHHYLGKE